MSRSETYSPPLSGSVLVPVPSPRIEREDYPSISISIVQALTARTHNSVSISGTAGRFFRRLSRRRPTSNLPNATNDAEQISDVETVTVYCGLWDAPDILENHGRQGTTLLRFRFSIPIPPNLPGTINTTLGGISYKVKATASPVSGREASTTSPIRIVRRMIPGPSQSVDHVRNYHGTRLSTTLRLVPNAPTNPKATKLAYLATLVARRTITRGHRAMELKFVVVKKLKWWVEETIRFMEISHNENRNESNTTCTRQCVRQICHGRQKGRWAASKYLGTQQQAENMDGQVQIAFDITIPRSTESADSLDLSSYTVSDDI
ncbi:hypothetical protein BBP40_003770, partial [Aspergillus hancockii]